MSSLEDFANTLVFNCSSCYFQVYIFRTQFLEFYLCWDKKSRFYATTIQSLSLERKSSRTSTIKKTSRELIKKSFSIRSLTRNILGDALNSEEKIFILSIEVIHKKQS